MQTRRFDQNHGLHCLKKDGQLSPLILYVELFVVTLRADGQIYDPDLVPAIVSTLSVFLNNDPESCAVIAATVRNESTLALFVDTCGERAIQLDIGSKS
jgi:hypothetical protein